ncbi:hypothetical protein QG37_03149 [Candidozyma auris]|uniref:Uncharacterized protein n=1 Tax=Candidozyma auris TaxID=498019 RepID=A0A0L0P021_CANAR|nr:hypothetical protein QG37_03149 [[Candida] auris]
MKDAIVEPIWEVEKKKKKKRNAHASGPVTGAGRVGQSQQEARVKGRWQIDGCGGSS